MASLADSFLDDLDDLDSDGEGNNEEDNEDDDEEDGLDQMLDNIKSGGDISSVASLRKSDAFLSHMAKIEDSLSKPPAPILGNVEDSPEYQLIVSCNDLVTQIDEEMLTVYKYVVDIYSKKFPELESLVPGRLDYIRAVQKIGNEMDMTVVDLAEILPNSVVISVSMTGSTTSGQPLSEAELNKCLEGCDEALALDEARTSILTFVETRMTSIAPNVCAILDTVIAAQLMGICGGLVSMSKIPACNLQVLGQQKITSLAGFGSAAAMPHTGLIYYSSVVQRVAPYLRMKALKVTAGKVALAARIDMHQSEPSGAGGQRLRAEIDSKFTKWEEPTQARTKKALPVPDDRPSKKRGGKRARKYKEKFGMTETRKEANRRTFGDLAGEYGDDAMGSDMGMLGMKQGGKLRLPPKKEQKTVVKAQKRKAVQLSSGATNGLSSSLVFTPVHGIELVGDTAAQRQAKVNEANQKWFSQNSGFLSARPT
jgi:U4/U6 small nuclear ribonucleoprotein PRP31